MTDLSLQRRLAAEVLGVGVSRIWIDPDHIDDVVDAITREDIKKLIKDRVIQVRPIHANSRERWRERHEQRKKGRRRGYGKRKGRKTARHDEKEEWMGRIRRMRRYLRYLRDHGVIDRKTYRHLYMLAKGGAFRSLNTLKHHIEEKGLAKK
jgi:large subunit ribosomal protein L19e